MNKILEKFTNDNKDNIMEINKLINLLNSTAEGSTLVSSNSYFKGHEVAVFNKKV